MEQEIQTLVSGENAEAILDILLVCANKPVNYFNLNSFSCEKLWKISKSFAIARDHSQDAIMTLQEADGFSGKMPELISFSGVEIRQEGLYDFQLYYAREEHFQDLVYKLAEERIKQSVVDVLGLPIEKARQRRECQIVQVYLKYLNDILFHKQSIVGIAIDIEKFKHHYDNI